MSVHDLPRMLPLTCRIMPIYEFYCPDNNKLYSFLARTLSYRDKVPVCPDDETLRMERRVSRFAVVGKAKEETADDPFAGIDEAKMDGFMEEMEREMSGLDEENPDPRQLGRFMRKMTDVMGEKTPPELREMVRRLESGEDPDKLEEEFGGMEDGDALFSQMLKRAKGARAEPVRDPKLYEMRDYVRE